MPRLKGYKHTEATIKKISSSKIGHKVSKATRNKIRLTLKKTHVSWNKGTKGICKPNKGSFKKGVIPWMKGRKHTTKAKAKMSESVRKSKRWKGGKTRRYGYILIYTPKHPCAVCGYVREHRVIMEKKIGRYLTTKERVHHRNEIKDDNRIENLQLLPNKSAHTTIHNELRRKKKCV